MDSTDWRDDVRARLSVIFGAQDSLGSEGGLAWLRAPHRDLDGRAPMDLLKVPGGPRRVLALLRERVVSRLPNAD